MKPIKIDDDWVRRQLIQRFSSREKIRYELKFVLRRLEPILGLLGISGFSIPLASISMSTKLIAGLVRRELKEERTFISHSKILESRGLGSVSRDLRTVIDSLPDFQAYIYATDEFFRDHIEHQIRVAVLGSFLLSQQFDIGGETTSLVDAMSSNMDLSKDEIAKAWWIAGLFHDIGMPVEKLAKNLNEVIGLDLANVYANLSLSVPEIDDPIPDEEGNRSFFEALTDGFSRRATRRLKMAMGWERDARVDHGAISALLLLKSIPGVSKNGSVEVEDLLADKFKPYMIAARAIMLHNLYHENNSVEIDSLRHPLAYFLVCCDEMQEWGREVNIKQRKLLDTRFRKARLVKHCLLELSNDTMAVSFEYRDQEAKDLCQFAFDYYFSDKEKNIGRLRNGRNIFPRICIRAKDFVFDKDQLIATPEKELCTGT